MNTWEQNRQELENQIKNDFLDLQWKLAELQRELENEKDEIKKQEKYTEIQKMEKELSYMKTKIDTLSSLQEQALESLKERIEKAKTLYSEINWDLSDLVKEVGESQEKKENINPTPTTYELLDWSNTYIRIENIISNNPEKFTNIKWNTAKEKVETIFNTIRSSITESLKTRLGESENAEKIINNTIAPALEWNFLKLLTEQWSTKNETMLHWMDNISFSSFKSLFDWVKKFGDAASETGNVYNKLSWWMNAVDYLAAQEKKFWILNYAENSEVLSNPLNFQKYLDIDKFYKKEFSVYENISLTDLYTLFGIDQSKTFKFWISSDEEKAIKDEIWNIQVESVDSVATVWKLVGKVEDFLKKSPKLQKTANYLLDWANVVNGMTKKILWIDVLGEFSKPPEERWFIYRVLDFVCKLIWITGWVEWILKNRRLDRLNLWDKTDSIVKMFDTYHKLVWDWESLSVVDDASCKTALAKFAVTDPTKAAATKWDFLRDAIASDIDISLLSPAVVQQTLWNSYLKKESIKENWKTQERFVVNEDAITQKDILKLAHIHMGNMKTYLEGYKDNDLKDFYAKIHNTDDLATCIIASLYADKDDVIEWVKAQVFIPESYRNLEYTGTIGWNGWWRENLDDWVDLSDKQKVSEQWIYDKAVEYWITDNRQIAYVLSTIKWESWFKNQKEIWWEDRDYWKIDSETWKAYYGRWFIQITHKDNYRRYTQIINNSWKDFKDNNGNVIKWSDVDLVNNPDIILQSNDLAAFIAMDRMKNGWPYRADNKRLDYYINDNKQDFYNARIIINWMTSKPQEYADRAREYLNKLWNWRVDQQFETKDIFIWTELLAKNKNEIWWLGNSIMVGFQWYKNKLNFPNMDWEESKNTQTHPNRFNSLLDVQWYKAGHPNVKSFMFYFWANTNKNEQTLSDIKQRSEWFQEEWIQPVLCTCIGEDNHTWLTDLNKSILDLWKEKNWPVFDFAKVYNRWDIAMWSGESPHPTSAWYTTMANLINEQLNKA